MKAPEAAPRKAESSAPIVLWLLPLLGSVVLPGLWWTFADRPFAFRPDLVGVMTVLVAVTATVVFGVASRRFRSRIRWSAGVTTILMIVGFQWNSFTAAGGAVADSTGIQILADVAPVGLAIALIWLTVRRAGELPFALVIGGCVGVVVIILIATAFSLVAPGPPAQASQEMQENAPHVLLLVLDAYGRSDWLEAEYEFDNREFLGALAARGFTIAPDATPNYGYTYGSVSTMLNLDYVFEPDEITDQDRSQMRAALTGAAGLFPALEAAGYETAYIENAWGGSQCGSSVGWCIRNGLTRRSLWNLGQMSILAPVLESIFPDPFNSLSTDHLHSLSDWLSILGERREPQLMFAHILLPHAPLLLDASCNAESAHDQSWWTAEGGEARAQRRSKYIEQLRCVNTLVLEAIDVLIAAQPDAVIMITGDHGPGSTLDVNLPLEDLDDYTIQERMRILSAYRLPGCDQVVTASLTPVNGARLVANCSIDAELSLLPDLNYWLNLDGEGRVTDITATVQR